MTVTTINALPQAIIDWDISLFSLNTNGLSNSFHHLLKNFLLKNSISFIQETRLPYPSDHDKIDFYWKKHTNQQGTFFYEEPIYSISNSSHPTGGLATFLHPDCPLGNCTNLNSSWDNPLLRGRYLLISATLENIPIYLHNVYAPYDYHDRVNFFNALPRDFPPEAFHIVGGDFNVIFSPTLDSCRPSTHATHGSQELYLWLQDLHLVDIFRQQNPLKRAFTSPKFINRLDYIFISSAMASLRHLKFRHLELIPHADHTPCKLLTKRPAVSMGPGPWKTPQWVLNNDKARLIISRQLETFLTKTQLNYNVGLHFDTMITNMRHQLKYLHDELVENQQKPLKKLSMDLALLIRDYQNAPCAPLMARIKTIQAAIHEFHDRKKVLREDTAMQNHLEKAERCTKFHLKPPRTIPLQKSPFKALKMPNGNIASDQQSISSTLHDFYSDLYGDHEAVDKERMAKYLKTLISRRLSQDDNRFIGAPLTANEFYFAIKHSKRNSTPGPNSLPYEILKMFPHAWSLALEMLYYYQLNSQSNLAPSQLTSLIVLLYKKDDKLLPKNYRPISLVNIDVKILTMVLAERMQRIVQSIVHPDQTGFIRGRSIQTNLLRLEDLNHFMKYYSSDSVVALLDFEKAFDRVNHSYLLATLKEFNFPPSFLNMVKVLYSNRRGRIIVNGHLSNPFKIQRGVLQGDPLSPLLFVLALEPMCLAIRKRKDLGICIGHHAHTGSYYADDSQLYSKNALTLRLQLDIVKKFCDISGFKLNLSKTELLTHANLPPDLAPLAITDDKPTKSLGLLISPNITATTRFKSLLEKLVTRTQLWSYRARTLPGKVTILRSICFPVLWYQLNFIPIDKGYAKLFDTVAKQFIHGDTIDPYSTQRHLHQFSSDIIFLPKAQGGLGFKSSTYWWSKLHRVTTFKCFKLLLAPPQNSYGQTQLPAWLSIGEHLLSRAFNPWGNFYDLLFMSPHSSMYKAILHQDKVPPLWSAFTRLWSSLSPTPFIFPTVQVNGNFPLWHNQFLPLEKTVFEHCYPKTYDYAVSLAKLNLTHVCHLFDENGNLMDRRILFDWIKSQCSRRHLVAPDHKWMYALHARLKSIVPSPPEDTEITFRQPTPYRQTATEITWSGNFKDGFLPFNDATLDDLSHEFKSKSAQEVLPTAHLLVPPDFFTHKANIKVVAFYRQPKFILPTYSAFIYRLLIRALPLRYKFKFSDDIPNTCIFCHEVETYKHFILDCRYTRACWNPFKSLAQSLNFTWPTTMEKIFFSPISLQDKDLQAGFNLLWPIFLSCIWYSIWKTRCDRIYRPDLPNKTPMTISILAGHIIKRHLYQLNRASLDDSTKASLTSVLHCLHQNEWLSAQILPRPQNETLES